MALKKRTFIIIITLPVLTILSIIFLGLWITYLKKPKQPDNTETIMPTYTDSSAGIYFVRRVDCLAQPPTEKKPLTAPPKIVMIMQTGGVRLNFTQSQCALTVRKLQEMNMEDENKTDIAYNWLVGGDGLVYTGRGWDIEGEHTKGYDNRSIGIAFIGNFEKESPTPAQIDEGEKLIQKGIDEKWIDKNYKLLAQRQCINSNNPGEKLYNIMKEWPAWSSACF